MRSGSPQLEDALAAGERTYDLQVRLGGRDVTDEVASWSVDRGSDTSLPDQIATPTGSSAAQAKLTLAGQGEQTAAARYSPWAPRSTADVTRPGQSCVLSWGLAEERMQALRGRITQVGVNAAAGTAQVQALDGAEMMRGRAWLPPAVIAGTGAYIHAQWAVDHALRMSDIHTSPPPREGAIFFASMNGSREANLGMRQGRTGTVGYYPQRSPWTAGPAGSPFNEYGSWSATYAPQKRVISQVNTLLVEWWIYRRNIDDNPTSQVELVFTDRPVGDIGTPQSTTITCSYDPATRSLYAGVASETSGSTTWVAPSSVNQSGRFKVAFEIALSTTSTPITVRSWLYQPNGALYSSSLGSTPAPVWAVLETITVAATGPMECVGVTPVSGVVDIVQTWRRGAVVDLIGTGGSSPSASGYALTALQDTSGTWWDLLKEIVGDSLGYVWFDEDGLLRVRGYDYITPDINTPEPDLTVTAARDIADISVDEDISGVANRIEVGLTTYASNGAQSEQYDYTGIITLPAGDSTTLRFNFQTRPWALRPPMYFAGATIPSGNLGSLVKWVTTTGLRSPVEIELAWDSGWPVITFTNRSGSTAYSALTSTLDAPSLRLAHAEVTQTTHQPVGREDTASLARFGVQSLAVSTSPWVQDAFWADEISRAVVAWTAWPVPLTGAVEVLPDPRIQIGDVVHIIDRTGTRIDGLYRVLGYTVRGSGPQVSMALDVRPLSRPEHPVDAGLTTEPVLDPALAPPLPG